MKKQFLEIGKIVGTHGLKGEVRVECWCDSPQFLCCFDTLYYDGGKKAVQIKSRPHKNIALAKIKGVDTVEQADLLRGRVLYLNRDDVSFDDGVNFVQDIIDSKVIDEETGKEYGVVTDVLFTGANDVYEMADNNGKKFYIPVIDSVVVEKDIDNSIIKIRPMKGLFADED